MPSPSRILFEFFAGAAANSFSYTGSGGATASGNATLVITWALSGTAGGSSSGTGTFQASWQVDGVGGGTGSGSGGVEGEFPIAGTGGGQSSGSGVIVVSWPLTGAGGASASGAGTLAAGWVLSGAGGGQSGGAATVEAVVSATYTGQGGGQSGGAATLVAAWVLSGTGGGTAGGSATVSFTSTAKRPVRGQRIWSHRFRPLPVVEPEPVVLWDAHRRGTATLVLSSESRVVWRWRSRRALPAELPVEAAARVLVAHAEVWEWRHGPVRSFGAGLITSGTSAMYYPGESLWLGLDLEEEEVLQ